MIEERSYNVQIGFLLFMKGRFSVLSVERSAVTAVPFAVYGRQA